MTDNINKISKNVDNQKQAQPVQQTAASLVHLTDEDVVKIWDSVSTYIESYMKQAKGVTIPGFGTFSFIQKRIDVGNNKYLLLQRPVFALSEKVVQTHGLKTTHHPVNGAVPVHPLNYFFIQSQSIYTRDQIEQCVKHVLQVFHRSIAAQRNVEFTFSRIGKLQIREGKVKMRFFKDFVQAVDENGGKHVVEAMSNRPQTSDSVMSERDAQRPATASNVVLPRLNSRVGNASMQAIQEEGQADDDQADQSASQTDTYVLPNEMNHSNSRADDLKLPPLLELHGEPTVNASPNVVKTTGPVLAQENIIPIASLFSSTDLPRPSSTMRKTSVTPSPMRRSTSFYQYEPSNEQTNTRALGSTTSLGFTGPAAEHRLASSMNMYTQKHPQVIEKPQTSCGHYGSGQELCHLCSQRAKRNIPIFLHEEKRAREEAEEKILEQFRHNQDLEEQKQREIASKAAREQKQRIAAFNLGAAEATRAKKLQRPQTTDIPRSIVFRKRIQTPPNYLRQLDLAKQLESQMKWKHDEQRAEKQDKDFVERLEQIQLAESLAQERESYFRKKRLHQDELKSALDDQVRNKPAELPVGELETPYFGMNDMTRERLQERRLHAMEILRQQKETVEQRQRQLLLKQMRDQEYETNVLQSIKQDLLADRREHYRRDVKIRKDLESDWVNAADAKQQRDQDERMHLSAPQGILVHEQCDQYNRCAQCQRNLENRGTSNFWKDTRYIPGTHVMV